MHDTIHESATCKNNSTRENLATTGLNTSQHTIWANVNALNGVLEKMKVGNTFKSVPPLSRKAKSIILASWTPHCRSFTSIQHAELNSARIADYATIPTKRVYLSDNLPLSDSAHCRIAAHLANGCQIH